MVRNASHTKIVDSKGRITLGGRFANRAVIVENHGDDLIIRLARVVPEREAWLYENELARGTVRRGVSQAKARKFAKSPNLAADVKLSKKLRDA